MSDPRTLYLIDANAYVHRAFHALPPLTNSRGEPVGALFGFSRMLLKLLKQNKPDHVAVCFDTAAKTFRHDAFPEYKANRKELDDALKFQLPLARDLAEAWGFPVLSLDGYEADDLIGTLAERGANAGFKVVVVTGDKDALQLVRDNISVLNEGKGIVYSEKEVMDRYGLRPDQLVDFFSLTGDAVDNVPGIPGVGEKTATQVLQKYGTLDQAIAHAAEMKPTLREKFEKHGGQALMSRTLIGLDRDVPVNRGPEDCLLKTTDLEGLKKLLGRFEFNSLLGEIVPGEAVSTPASAPSASDNGPRPKTTVVLAENQLAALARELQTAEELAVDVETTGTDPLRDELVGIALAVPGKCWYIPLKHRGPGAPAQLSGETVRRALGPILTGPKPWKVGQNLKFDDMVLRRNGLPLGGIHFDTLIASYCLNPSRLTHNLKDLSRDMLGAPMTPIEDLIGKGAKQTSMDQVDVERTADYAGNDAHTTLLLEKIMAPALEEKGMGPLYHDVEMPLLGVLRDMEERGIRIDAAYLGALGEKFAGEASVLEREVHGLAGGPLNLNSPKQLSALLFGKLGLPVVRRTKTGFSTDEEVLRKLSARHPLPAKLVDYRELSKLKSTFIDALLALVNPDTGRIHTRFNQAVAATGRLSSSDPNLQNIPIRSEHGRAIRRGFVPSPGSLFLSADYSQIDLRVLAHISGDPALQRAFRAGEDVHSATARDIFGLGAGDPISAEQRRVAKSVNFGIVYGQTAFGLSQQIGLDRGRAQEYIAKYFARYAGVEKWIAKVLEEARRNGYVTTLLNRRRYLPEINAANASVRGFAERTAMNTPIQGTSADIIKIAMRDVEAHIKEKGLAARMLVQVHDELLFEVPAAQMAGTAMLIREKMEKALPLDVPVVVDLKTGPNWADMEKL